MNWHKALKLRKDPTFNVWEAIRLCKHGSWISARWPMEGMRQSLMGALLSDDAWYKAVFAMRDHVTDFKDTDLDTLQWAAEVAIKAAVEAVTTDE